VNAVTRARAVTVVGLAALLGGCAVQAAPSHLGGAPLKAEPLSKEVRADGTVGQVTIDSRYGHGTVSGPVRRGARNLEVRLPGGSWVDCGKDCGETLRRQSVDFWENHGRDGRDGPDYLSWRR
jgi:hypothetical protein